MAIKYMFSTGGEEKEAHIVRKMPEDSTYLVRTEEGETVRASAEDIRPVSFGLIFPYYGDDSAAKLAHVRFSGEKNEAVRMDLYPLRSLYDVLMLYNGINYDMALTSLASDFVYAEKGSDGMYEKLLAADYMLSCDDEVEFDEQVLEFLETLISPEALKIDRAVCDFIAMHYGSEIHEPSYNIEALVCAVAEELDISRDLILAEEKGGKNE